MTEDLPKLWQNMARLGRVEGPLVSSWSEGLVGERGPGRTNLAVLGQDWRLRRPETVHRFLDLLGGTLGVDRGVWKWQRPFLAEFVGSFFTTSHRSAWITVHAVRRGFGSRLLGTRHRHFGSMDAGYSVPLSSGERRLLLSSGSFSLRSFLPYHPTRQRGSLTMRRLHIHRFFHPAEEPRELCATEERLVVVAGEQDLTIARRGQTPALEHHRSEDDVHSCPLVTLCRLDERGRILLRCFSLAPLRGEIADLRFATYLPAYYFKGDMGNHYILERLIADEAHDSL